MNNIALRGYLILNKKASLLMGIVLTTILALSIVPSAYAGTWIYYDDDEPDGSTTAGVPNYLAVRFTTPTGGSYKLITARFMVTSGFDISAFNVHIFDSDGSTSLFGPLAVTPTSGWNDVDLSSYGILVSGDFYIAAQYTTSYEPTFELDRDFPIDYRSHIGTPGSWGAAKDYDLMFRAEVDPIPVGGVVYSPDKLGLLSPLLILTGLIGAIVITSFIVKKRGI